ncbi:HNH endonuclease [bacterium]|nr:HNH endonuclease [bacterium]
MRKVDWTRPELILALDLYYKTDHILLSDQRVHDLSQHLINLNIYPIDIRPDNFRNPSGVYNKLLNYASLDPNHPINSRDNGGRLTEAIFMEFENDTARLFKCASLIYDSPVFDYDDVEKNIDATIASAIEGGRQQVTHSRIERNAKLSLNKKKDTLKRTNALACEVCGFDFENYYGTIGKHFAECHHIVPLGELSQERETTLNDLAIVCANCHRMLHRRKDMTIAMLIEIINSP